MDIGNLYFMGNMFPYILQIHDNAMWGNQTLRQFSCPHYNKWPTYILMNWPTNVNWQKPMYQTSQYYINKGHHRIMLIQPLVITNSNKYQKWKTKKTWILQELITIKEFFLNVRIPKTYNSNNHMLSP